VETSRESLAEKRLEHRLKFGEALEFLKRGFRIARNAWPFEVYLTRVKRWELRTTDEMGYDTAASSPGGVLPMIVQHTELNQFRVWAVAHEDLLAEDWETR
jgi:Protein of unknown function (DUF2829)